MRTYLSLSVSSCRKMLWLSKAEQVVKVGNVVAIAALKHGIDLNGVGKTFLEVEYRPEQLSRANLSTEEAEDHHPNFGSNKMV